MFLQDLVNQVDKDGTGNIDFPEFLSMMSLKYELETAEDEIRTAFQVFDRVIKCFIISYHILLHLSLF